MTSREQVQERIAKWLFKFLYEANERGSFLVDDWKQLEPHFKEVYYQKADELLRYHLSDPSIAILAEKQELPENPYAIRYASGIAYLEAQQDMLKQNWRRIESK